MIDPILPHALRPGGTLGIAAPAGPVDPERLARGERWLREAGFEIRRRPDLIAQKGYLAGDDERRAKELMELVRDDAVDPILCARGGYGCHRIARRLDHDGQDGGPAFGGGELTVLVAPLDPGDAEARL